MRPPEAVIEEAVTWLRQEAARYVVIAQRHAAQAELMAIGTDRIAVNPHRRDQYQAMAKEAALQAQQFLDFALAIRTLAPGLFDRALERGEVVPLMATFLRPCAAEDFPGEGLFRLPAGDVVRAPLAPLAGDLRA